MFANAPAYRHFLALSSRFPATLAALLVSSVLAALVEGLGIGLLIPLLADLGEGSRLLELPVLGALLQALSSLSWVSKVRFAAVALIVVFVLRNGLLIMEQILSSRLQLQVEKELHLQIFRQLHDVDLDFISRQQREAISSLLGPQMAETRYLLREIAGSASYVCVFAVMVLLMLALSWPLTLLTLALFFCLGVISEQRFAGDLRLAGDELGRLTRHLFSIHMENLSGMRLIRLFARERWSFERFTAALGEYQSQSHQNEKMMAITKNLFACLVVVCLSLILFAGSFAIQGQAEASVGQLVLFLVIAIRLKDPASGLNYLHSKVIALSPYLESVLDFLKRDDKPYMKDGKAVVETLRCLSFDGVRFRYPATEREILRGATLELPRGQVTAMVGPSGAGKSTIVGLITRLYDPDHGRILVDDVDLKELSLESWRSKIAVVSQDPFLFNDTVRNNLVFARLEATDEEVVEAARLAQAHGFITELADGYETLVGDRGVRISGGQRQRIAIARALLAEKELLIMDEATSAIDSETEEAIQQAIGSLGCTVLIIAHRLTTVRAADRVLVLSHGRVVEQGTHEELIQNDGLYRRLFRAQEEDDVSAPVDLVPSGAG